MEHVAVELVPKKGVEQKGSDGSGGWWWWCCE